VTETRTICPGCGERFEPTPVRRTFCRPSCRARAEHRARTPSLFAEPLKLESEWPPDAEAPAIAEQSRDVRH
jgi:hypothetical protein